MIERLLLEGKILRFEFEEKNGDRIVEVDIPRVSYDYEGIMFYVEEQANGAFYNYTMELESLSSFLNKSVLSCIDFNIYQDGMQIY